MYDSTSDIGVIIFPGWKITLAKGQFLLDTAKDSFACKWAQCIACIITVWQKYVYIVKHLSTNTNNYIYYYINFAKMHTFASKCYFWTIKNICWANKHIYWTISHGSSEFGYNPCKVISIISPYQSKNNVLGSSITSNKQCSCNKCCGA